jgi:integrase
LKKACTEAGVPVVTPHDFRVFFNTRLLQAGVHPELVRAMTGHTTQAMTEHYAHVSADDKITHLAPLMRDLTGEK